MLIFQRINELTVIMYNTIYSFYKFILFVIYKDD